MSTQNRQFLLASRPYGHIKDQDLEYREVPVPVAEKGQMVVKNLYLSLDPAIRGWMNEMESYIKPIALGEVMRGMTVGEVVTSNLSGFEPGDKVSGFGGWQDYYVSDGSGVRNLPDLGLPLTNFLGVLGGTGLTAYFGLLDIGGPKAGETVVVSAAAGAVGSVVGQIARIKGCRVVGIAGSEEKCDWITEELGFDAAVNYKARRWTLKLRRACPDRIDIYFDNVGGDMLNTALALINIHARVVVCGAISQYNATELVPGPANYIKLLIRRARMEGFVVIDYAERYKEGLTALAKWVQEGRIKHKEDIVDGLAQAPEAIHRLFKGTNRGKLIVRL